MSMINWNKFQEKFGKNCHDEFENLARMIFRIEELNDPYINLIQLSNQAGIEVEPVEYNGEKISFQAKFFTGDTDYQSIKDSADKIIKYYRNKITKVILYCNKKLNYNKSPKYAQIVQDLKDNGIELEPFCDENILDLLKTNRNYLALKELYFGDKDYSFLIKERCEMFTESIKRSFIDDSFIERSELKTLINNLDKKYIIMHGDANTGKSSILAGLCEYFKENSIQFLPINLDINYPEETLTQYSNCLGFNISLDSLILAKSEKDKFYLILDQFDAIRWNSHHSTNALTMCDKLIESLSHNKNTSIIVVTRTVDLQEVRSITAKHNNELETKEIKVDKIEDSKLREICGKSYFKLNNQTKNLLYTIGNIKLFKQLSQNTTNLISPVELIKEFFNQKYDQLKLFNCDAEAKQIEDFVLCRQKEKNQLYVNENEITLKYSKSTLAKMIEVGIFEKTENSKIRYSHQCLYDYKLASDLYFKYKDGKDIRRLLRENNKKALENLDIVKQFLELLKTEENKFYEIIEEILFDKNIRYLFKKLALSEFISFDYRSDSQVKLFYKIIKNNMYGKKYLYQLTVNKPTLIESIIDNKIYDSELSNLDFNQYSSLLSSVLCYSNKIANEYLNLINGNINNKERLNKLIHGIDDIESPRALFDVKIEILKANPKFFEYHSIESLDSKNPERLLEYIKAIIEIEDPKNMIDLISAKKIPATLEKYAIEINKKIYDHFCKLPKTYGLHYYYYIDGFHLYEKLDWLKDCFQHTLKFLDVDTYLTYLESPIGFVKDSVLNILPELKVGHKLINYLIDSKFISKQNFHYNRNRIHLISKCLGCYNAKISKTRHFLVEQEILDYRIPNWIDFAKERFSQRKLGISCAIFGEEQKILLNSLIYDKLKDSTKEFLRFLNRRFTKLEMYPIDFKEGVTECRTVVSCINDKMLNEKQWIKILTNEKTGSSKVFSSKIDQNGNFVSSDMHSIKHSIFVSANNNKEMFIHILQNFEIRKEFIPTILEALAVNNKNEINSYHNENILNIFMKYINLDDEYIVSSFLRFIEKSRIYNDDVIVNLLAIAKKDSSCRLTCLNEKDEYTKIWQEHFNNNQTFAIYILSGFLLTLSGMPDWVDDLLQMCQESNNLMLKLSELELYYGCLNFDKTYALEKSFNLINKYPLLARDNHFIKMIDICIVNKLCQRKLKKFYLKYDNNLTLKTKEIIISRIISYFVYYGYFKSLCLKIIKKDGNKNINLTSVLFELIDHCVIKDSSTKPLNDKQIKRFIQIINKIIVYHKKAADSLLLKAKEYAYFFEYHNILNKLFNSKNKEFMYVHALLDVIKILSPITKYDSLIFKSFIFQIKNNEHSLYYINEMLNCFYKIYGEYEEKQKRKKEKCITKIEHIYKIAYNSNLLSI